MLQDKSREIIKFRHTLKGFSSKTLAAMLKELQRSEILERKSYNETPPRAEYNLTNKGQLVESIINLLQWMGNGVQPELLRGENKCLFQNTTSIYYELYTHQYYGC